MIERRDSNDIAGTACPFCGAEFREQQGPAKHIRYECPEVGND